MGLLETYSSMTYEIRISIGFFLKASFSMTHEDTNFYKPTAYFSMTYEYTNFYKTLFVKASLSMTYQCEFLWA